jgi:uncharacterized protein (UPF0264 family)
LAVAGLLVSVRSTDEALAALEGGAAVVDIKEPGRGPLGRAEVATWSAVRGVVPRATRVSVALGELAEWDGEILPASAWSGIAYRKLGLAGTGPDWAARWAEVRDRNPGPPWVAVAYADWTEARSPEPDAVLDEALSVPDCVGLLIDTWHKGRPSQVDDSWFPLISRAKAAGRLVALAGGIDHDAIRRLAPLGPDLFAVRGAACAGGDRLSAIDPARVAALVRLAGSVGV